MCTRFCLRARLPLASRHSVSKLTRNATGATGRSTQSQGWISWVPTLSHKTTSSSTLLSPRLVAPVSTWAEDTADLIHDCVKPGKSKVLKKYPTQNNKNKKNRAFSACFPNFVCFLLLFDFFGDFCSRPPPPTFYLDFPTPAHCTELLFTVCFLLPTCHSDLNAPSILFSCIL